jgi:Ca-activated chloride channel family protein
VGFVRYEGREVWSVMDERLLKEIAMATGGAYVPARTRAYDLGQIYDEHLAQLTRSEVRAEKRKRYAEQFQLFVCLGLFCFLVELSIPKYPSARRQATAGPLGSAPPAAETTP